MEVPYRGNPLLKHKFGYVFCHRALYERASRFSDNSNSATESGRRHGFFLHEVDAFIGKKIRRRIPSPRSNSRSRHVKEGVMGALSS
ncbi:hypothetical protein F5B21DRAFT_453556 [Xylaria acuta]|nr:hypothetical protein F5B21DRAFT_453556 [Xylaria acuta]